MFKQKTIESLKELAVEAGEVILSFYERETAVERKSDKSPVTQADIAANDLLLAGLHTLTPGIPVISEEGGTLDVSRGMAVPPHFWLIDPLDGTKSFIKRTGEFTVNLGLIEHRKTVWGLVYLPVPQTLYYVDEAGDALRQENGRPPARIGVRKPPADGLTVVASQSHLSKETEEYIRSLPSVRSYKNASSSLKFCLVAEGSADLYPRFGPTMEWDTAAAHAVLEAAGGRVVTPEGDAFLYGKVTQEKPLLNGNFIAKGGGFVT